MISTRVGFTGGQLENPTYQEVCRKKSGHAEAVELTFDPEQTNFETLARYFFQFHDPTINRTSGGGQYRSAIFYQNAVQLSIAHKLIEQLSSNGYQVATTLEAAAKFWPAETRHQKYCNSRGMQPKDRFQDRFQSI